MVSHPARFGSQKQFSVPLEKYLAAGGQLQPGDPPPGNVTDHLHLPRPTPAAPRVPREVFVRELGIHKLKLSEVRKRLLRSGADRLSVGGFLPLKQVEDPPYELARETLDRIGAVLLPKTAKAAELISAAATADDAYAYLEPEQLSDAEWEAATRAYLADLEKEEEGTAGDERTASLLVRSERGDVGSQTALFTSNTAAGFFGGAGDVDVEGSSMRHLNRMLGFQPASATGARVRLHGL